MKTYQNSQHRTRALLNTKQICLLLNRDFRLERNAS